MSRVRWSLLLILVACGPGPVELPPPGPAPTTTVATPPPPAVPRASEARSRPPRERVRVPYRMEVGTSDPATANFAEVVRDVLTDPRGWRRAGFDFVEDPNAEYRIILAEGPQVDALCRPMETWSKYSCQNGPVVALNANRWRSATPKWTGDLDANPAHLSGGGSQRVRDLYRLDSYRVMLINHEVGHLLHLHHPTVQCPAPRLPAPVMSQQSTELGECRPNPWPLRWEVRLAARRLEPLAPPPAHDTADHRPTPPPVER